MDLYLCITSCTCIQCVDRSERRKYYHHREKSRNEPHKYITVILDGMDQNKTNIPNLPTRPKSTQNLWRLRTHLTGGLVHTKTLKGKYAYAYYDLLQWPHNCNITLNVLLRILEDLDTLPPTLYLQLDNCFRENKNKYLLAFCAYLVHKKLFKKVNNM